MNWLKEVFGVKKPVIAMCHLHALPGDPEFTTDHGMDWIVERAREDLLALQAGGVHAIMFSNECSLPYLTKVAPITTAAMARVIGELRREITVAFGVNVLWDPFASIDLAVATGARFVREIFTGVYGSDFGLWNTDCGAIVRHRNALHGQKVRLFFNIVPESAAYVGVRNIEDIARSTVFNARPDALCVSGLTAGAEASTSTLQGVKKAVPDTPVFANTGVNLSNIDRQLAVADGVIIGTTFKRDGYIWNEVDTRRVKAVMDKVKTIS